MYVFSHRIIIPIAHKFLYDTLRVNFLTETNLWKGYYEMMSKHKLIMTLCLVIVANSSIKIIINLNF